MGLVLSPIQRDEEQLFFFLFFEGLPGHDGAHETLFNDAMTLFHCLYWPVKQQTSSQNVVPADNILSKVGPEPVHPGRRKRKIFGANLRQTIPR